MQCPVCYIEQNPNSFFVPSCGHALCGACYNRLQDSSCPVCRHDAPSWTRLYANSSEDVPDVLRIRNASGNTPLIEAVLSGALACDVVRAIAKLSNCKDVNADGDTALHVAIKRGSVDTITMLLDMVSDLPSPPDTPVDNSTAGGMLRDS